MYIKVPVSSLTLPPASHLLTHCLTPDAQIKSPAEFLQVLKVNPSIQRRSRPLSPESHFSYTSPLPTPFPYRIQPPQDEDRGAYIEKCLSELEAQEEQPLALSPIPGTFKKFASKNRDQERVLIGLSETGLSDCLPNLDVGDSFSVIGTPTLSRPTEQEQMSTPSPTDVSARQDLIDVLSGHSLLVSFNENSEPDFAPWSLRYSGHQFGTWAGQLGDGRAVSVLVTPHPSDPDLTHEVQLKGAGRTPFARSADGLAVVRSSIREFLAAEAMQALSIPTTRSLSLISLPTVEVWRERVETACIATRIAPSFVRIGCFEALNAPPNIMLFGAGQQPSHWDALMTLGEWVGRAVLRLDDVSWVGESRQAWGKKLVQDVARRNAIMVAGWQAYGFMHGVINTDNVSILGLTIDYGPYAFMDVFDRSHICNHSDEEGRYSYKRQPNMTLYALRSLLNSLAPLIGAESELNGSAVSAGWADNVPTDKIESWTKEGRKIGQELDELFNTTYEREYIRLMRKRLGLRRQDANDESLLIISLLDIMQEFKLDFHSTFRQLSNFTPSVMRTEGVDDFISAILALTPEARSIDRARAASDIRGWLGKYANRIQDEYDEWKIEPSNDIDATRRAFMKSVNPRFVLRQWVLEEVISKVERDTGSGRRVLAKVLQMACKPFEPWGGEDRPEIDLDEESLAERSYCGIGDVKMLGFQCSCSS